MFGLEDYSEKNDCKIYFPKDVKVGKRLDSESNEKNFENIEDDDVILDVGSKTLIEIKKIISHQYSSRFAQKSDISPCTAAKRVIDGINPLEVISQRFYNKKQGFFEKMFNFFD